MFQDKIVVITGFAQGLGRCMAEAYRSAGATVCGIDLLENDYYVGDIGEETVLTAFIQKVIADFGHIDVLVNNAKPQMKGLDSCSYEDFEYALRVGVTAPFYLAQGFALYFREGGSILNISSARAHMSQPQGESYAAAKGGISALTHALALSMGPRVRVNAISPGWIDTTGSTFSGSDCTQHPVGRVGVPTDIANMALFLTSPQSAFVTGQDFVVDGGMNRQLIYHGDENWTLN